MGKQQEIQEDTNGIKNPPRRRRNQWRQESAEKTLNSKKKLMASRHPPRRRRNQWRQESTEKKYNKKKSNAIKNPPRRHFTARRNQWHQESAKKTLKKKLMASRHPPRSHSKKKPMASRICQEDTEEETNGVKNPPRRHSTASRNHY